MADTSILNDFLLRMRLEGSYRDNLGLADPLISPRVSAEIRFTDGAGADQIQLYFQERLTITDTSPNKDYDLADDTMKDPFGRTLAFTSIKGILLVPETTNLNEVEAGAAAADPWESWTPTTGSKFKVEPGSPWMLTNRSAGGWAVGAANDQFRLHNPTVSSNDVVIDVYIIGLGTAT